MNDISKGISRQLTGDYCLKVYHARDTVAVCIIGGISGALSAH